MTQLTKLGKFIQGTAAAVAVFIGFGIVGANDFQDATRAETNGVEPTAWVILAAALAVVALLEALKHSK